MRDRTGMPRETIPVVYPTTLTPREWRRFLELVDIPADFTPPEDESAWRATPCWTWRGNRNENGYGRFRFYDPADPRGCRYRYAHRLMYALVFGPVPLDREIDHTCERRACVSPYHLRLVHYHANVGFANGTVERADAPWRPADGDVHGQVADDIPF